MLNSNIESLLEGHSLNALSKEREKLTEIYRSHDLKGSLKALSSDQQRLAYLATRLPATHAALCFVFKELLKRKGEERIASLLDVGAGPGTALLAGLGNFFFFDDCDPGGKRFWLCGFREAFDGKSYIDSKKLDLSGYHQRN